MKIRKKAREDEELFSRVIFEMIDNSSPYAIAPDIDSRTKAIEKPIDRKQKPNPFDR